MQKNKLPDNGFHLLGLVLVIFVGGLISFAGFRLFHLTSNSTAAGEPNKQSVPTISVPPRFKLFADRSSGVQFIYPDVYGSFKIPTQECCGMTTADFPEYVSVLTSNRISVNYLPGVAGFFGLGTYKKGVMEVDSRTYGPRIKLVGDTWKVTEPNQYDTRNYKSGDTYSEMTRTNVRGLNVYTAQSISEGITTYKLHFVTNGRLRTLQLPPFDSELYSSTYNVNDQAPYDAMYAQIRDSISLF